MSVRSLVPVLLANGSIEMRSFPPAKDPEINSLHCLVISKEQFEEARANQNIMVDDVFMPHKDRLVAIRAFSDQEWEEAWRSHNNRNPSLSNKLLVVSSYSFERIFGRVQYPYIPPPEDWPIFPPIDIDPALLEYSDPINRQQFEALSMEVKEKLYINWVGNLVQLSLVPNWLLEKYWWPDRETLFVSATEPVRYNLIR